MKNIFKVAGIIIPLFMQDLFAVEPECSNGKSCYIENEPMVISATRWQTSGIPTASSITIITREQIIESGANRVEDILRGQGGVQLQDLYGDGSRTSVSLRGFGENAGANTLVLVDGRRLNNTDLKTPDLGFISVKDIERIEIIQGSAAVLYGDQAVGGAINIITRKTDGKVAVVEAGLGNYGHHFETARVENRFYNGLGIRLSVEQRQSDNYRNHNDLSYDNLFANLDYEWDRGRVFLEYLHVDEDLETPGALFRENLTVSRQGVRALGAMDFNDSTSDAGRIGGLFRISSNWEMALEYTHRNENVDGCLVFCTPFSQHRVARAFNPRIRGLIPFGDHTIQLITGSDIENTEYKLVSTVGNTFNDQDMYAIYGLATIPVNNQLSFTGGARYARLENNNHTGDPFSAPFPLLTSKNDTDDQVAWSAGLVFKPAPPWRLFMKGETVFRFPLADELSGTATPGDLLKTQTGESYEAGIEWHNHHLQTKVTGYFLDLENEIAFDPNAGIFGANVNFDPTNRMGTILEINFFPFEQLDIGAQYSYTHAEFDGGVYDGNRVPLVAEHQLHIHATWRFMQNLSLFGEIFIISDRVAGADLGDDHPDLPGYGISNLNIRYDNGNIFVSGKVNNILDNKYSDFAAIGFNENKGFALDTGYYPAPERNFMLTLGYTFDL